MRLTIATLLLSAIPDLTISRFATALHTTIDYREYHAQINIADSLIFTTPNFDAGLSVYEDILTTYPFVFTKDVVNYINLCHYFDRTTATTPSLPIAPECRVTQDSNRVLLPLSAAGSDSVISLPLRRLMMTLANADQEQKTLNIDHPDRIILTKEILSIIKSVGFPSERLVGIDAPGYSKSHGTHYTSTSKRIDQRDNIPVNRYIEEEPCLLGSKSISLIMIHNPCMYSALTSHVDSLIATGQMHPGEAALIYDNQRRFETEVSRYCPRSYDPSIFLDRNMFAKVDRTESISRSRTEALRAQLHLPSIAVDSAKAAFSDSTGIQLYWGFWSSQ